MINCFIPAITKQLILCTRYCEESLHSVKPARRAGGGGGGRYSHILAKGICEAGKGMVFKPFGLV